MEDGRGLRPPVPGRRAGDINAQEDLPDETDKISNELLQAASGRLRSSVVILEIGTEVAASDVGPYSAPGPKRPNTSADRSKAIQELPETQTLSQGRPRKTSASRTWAKPLGAPEAPSTPQVALLGPSAQAVLPSVEAEVAMPYRQARSTA